MCQPTKPGNLENGVFPIPKLRENGKKKIIFVLYTKKFYIYKITILYGKPLQQNTAETRALTKLAAMQIAVIKKQLCRIIEETAYYMSTVRLKCPTWSTCPRDMKLEAP